MVLQNHRPLHREIFTDEVVLPAPSHHTPPPHTKIPPRAQRHEGELVYTTAHALRIRVAPPFCAAGRPSPRTRHAVVRLPIG